METTATEKVKPFHGINDPALKAQAEQLTLRELFEMRLIREGRRDEHLQLVSKLIESDVHPVAAHAQAAEKMGRKSLNQERQLYINHIAKEAYLSQKLASAKEMAVVRRRTADMAFWAALQKLPPNASAEVELDWVRAHPAMSMLNRTTLKGKPRKVMVKEKDILSPPHGQAPSQAAVHMLQHWCNQPNDFFGKMLMEQRKQSPRKPGRKDEPDEESEELDDDTSELDAMLGH